MCSVQILDTNTILEPIKLCICGRKYEIDKTKTYKYNLNNVNGEIQLFIDGKIISLIEMKE